MQDKNKFDSRNKSFYLQALGKAIAGRRGSSKPRLGGGLPATMRRIATLAKIAAFQLGQAKKRERAARVGTTIPGILISSITRRCNLDCEGCYSKALRPGARPELSDERLLSLFEEATRLGTGTIMLAGGEPLLRRNLVKKAAGLRGVAIPVFTNGTLVDAEYLDLFTSGRLIPIFSVEGDEQFTTGRRGIGVHEAAMAAAAELRRRGALFGFSVTLTARNADSALSDRFLREIEELGASVLFLIEYVPVASGTDGLVLRDDQKADLSRPGRFDRYAFMTVSLPGDEEAFGGCLAAGRGFIHLADDGALEACPFAPFSDSNAADRSLAEALDSPLMREIRARHGELTETKGGCALWNKRGWAASLSACALGPRSSAERADA